MTTEDLGNCIIGASANGRRTSTIPRILDQDNLTSLNEGASDHTEEERPTSCNCFGHNFRYCKPDATCRKEQDGLEEGFGFRARKVQREFQYLELGAFYWRRAAPFVAPFVFGERCACVVPRTNTRA